MPQICLFRSMSENFFSSNIVRIISLFVRTKIFLPRNHVTIRYVPILCVNRKIEKSDCKLYVGFVKDLAYILKRLQPKSQM